MRIDVMGIGFDNVDINQALERSLSMLNEPRRHYIVTPNSEIVMTCAKNDEARMAVNDADLVIADGVGVVLASKILGTPLKCKVAGIDLAAELMRSLAKTRKRLFLLGAKPGTAERAAKKLSAKYKGLVICGTNDGYFKNDEDVINKIIKTNPDVLFVCLGAPKQEIWIFENIASLDIRLIIGLGGSLDVFAGQATRAPDFFIRLGLEWFYRLFKEPSRITRMIKLPVFILKAVWIRLFKRG